MRTLFSVALLSLSFNAIAEGPTTIRCMGKSVSLEEIAPYLGENSPNQQSLFKLKRLGTEDSTYEAYFLDIDYDAGRGNYYISSTNSSGGKFSLVTTMPTPENENDPASRLVSTGTLTYKHGPIKGKEKVNCVQD